MASSNLDEKLGDFSSNYHLQHRNCIIMSIFCIAVSSAFSAIDASSYLGLGSIAHNIKIYIPLFIYISCFYSFLYFCFEWWHQALPSYFYNKTILNASQLEVLKEFKKLDLYYTDVNRFINIGKIISTDELNLLVHDNFGHTFNPEHDYMYLNPMALGVERSLNYLKEISSQLGSYSNLLRGFSIKYSASGNLNLEKYNEITKFTTEIGHFLDSIDITISDAGGYFESLNGITRGLIGERQKLSSILADNSARISSYTKNRENFIENVNEIMELKIPEIFIPNFLQFLKTAELTANFGRLIFFGIVIPFLLVVSSTVTTIRFYQSHYLFDSTATDSQKTSVMKTAR